MRHLLISGLLLVILFPSLALGGEVTVDDLIFRPSDGLIYKKFTKVPFSGTVTGQYQGKVKNGRKVGRWDEYHKGGWLSFTGTYKDGIRDGLWESYGKNGQLASKGHYKYAIREGFWEFYKEDGTKRYTPQYGDEGTGTYKNDKWISD
jgi:hypothetical protein